MTPGAQRSLESPPPYLMLWLVSGDTRTEPSRA